MAQQQPPQQFCVRWNSYQSNLQNAFPKLLTSEHFVDVTLACENEMLKCHKVVLSACSTYFEKLLLDNPCQHPIILMKDMKFQEMQLLVDFMYKGEVNVSQDDLPSLLKSAEALQIRGLCGSDQLLSQQHLKLTVPPPPQQQQQQSPLKVVSESSSQHVAAAAGKNPSDSMMMVQQQKSSDNLSATAASANCSQKQLQQEEEQKVDGVDGLNPSSSDCDSNDAQTAKDEPIDTVKEEIEDDSFYENESDLMESEFLEDDTPLNPSDLLGGAGGNKHQHHHASTPNDFAIANVSCHYNDGSPPGSAGSNRRIRRSDEELRRAAECITRGQTFQTVSDQFNIPISTIRFYMARKGILPRRKRGRACSGPSHMLPALPHVAQSHYNSPGNTSPIGPPYHIVHYKLPTLGMSKLK